MSELETPEAEIAISVSHLSKTYRVYDRPQDRLYEFLSFGLIRNYREFIALEDVSFDVRRGESLAIIGPNGAGKTTLLSIIAGITAPSAGEVRVKGRMAVMLALGTAFNPEFTGRENVRMTCSIQGLTPTEIIEREPLIEAFAEIGEFIDQPVRIYSSGMQARLAFAVAAHVDADVLVVDEILAVGDAVFTQRCGRFIRQFRKRGTLLFVSHDVNAALSLCERAIWLNDGHIQQMGRVRDIVAAYWAWSFKTASEDPDNYIEGGDKRALEQPDHFKTEISADPFDPKSPHHGEGGARIVGVGFFLPRSADRLSDVRGGTVVELRVEVVADQPLEMPIIGFFIRDPTGQVLFGDNTLLVRRDNEDVIATGSTVFGLFEFQMPFMPTGTYMLTAAIADRVPPVGKMLHWFDQALIFRVTGSHVSHGLIGLPMRQVRLSVRDGLNNT